MISKNKELEKLTKLHEDLDNYFSNTIIPQLFIDTNLLLRKFTPPAMKQFKLKEEFFGKKIAEIKQISNLPSIVSDIKVVITTGKSLEKEIQTKDMKWYQMNILPYVVRRENRVNGVIITFIDITKRISDLKEQERLIAAHELLLDTISHDIKNPLLGLGLTVEMLLKLSEKNMERLPFLIDNAEKSFIGMKNVVEDLIVSRREKYEQSNVEELIDINNVFEDVCLALANQIIETDAIITQGTPGFEVKFVRRKLRSVLYNLISNAIKYTAPNTQPHILFSCSKKDGYINLSVTDNGIGISSEKISSIFDKFSRLEKHYEGTGVGLYLVNTMVKEAGGRVEVQSKPGRGSIFTICLKDHSS